MAYKNFTGKLRLFIHTILSSPSISTTFPCNLTNKSPTLSTSQSFKGHEKQGFQWPFSPWGIQRSTTQASFAIAKANKEGKETHNGSSPHLLSVQNFTLLPLPTLKEKWPKKEFRSFLMDFQRRTPYPPLATPDYHPPSSSPYLPPIIHIQKAPFSLVGKSEFIKVGMWRCGGSNIFF